MNRRSWRAKDHGMIKSQMTEWLRTVVIYILACGLFLHLQKYHSNLCLSSCHFLCPCIPLSSVKSLSGVQLFMIPLIAAHQASLSITNSWSSLELMTIQSIMPSSHLIPFSYCHHTRPESEYFPRSQLFAWGGQSTGVSASASVLPKNTQGWSPSEWTSWISLQSKGLSRVFSNTIVR